MSARMRLPTGLVTFLFTDIEGSTRLAQMLGAQYRAMLTEHRRVLRRAFAPADGAELFTEGDSLFLAFPDATAALAACATAQRALSAHDWPVAHAPRVRMGLHTGYARPHGGEYASPEVHRAARVAAAAHGGQVLCSAATAQAATAHSAGGLPENLGLTDLGLHRLRGFDSRERLFQVTGPGLDREFPRPRGALAAAHNLPAPVTSFIGRDAELRDLSALLRRQRLVNVVGPAGAGKTRLAVELASRLVDGQPDGVCFADLAGVAEPELVEACVAEAFGLRPEPGRPLADTLAEHVAPRRMLLVLDTCDAQPEAAAGLVGRLLRGGGGLTVLVTSREPLGLPGELVWRIPPLALRPAGPDEPSDAVALLLDRAAAARGGAAVLPHELADLSRVATAMDGLPLALELAAARLRVLSAGQLAARLHDVLTVLDAGRATSTATSAVQSAAALRAHQAAYRHRTMEAAVEWSYRTLPDGAARLLRLLSVFAGPVDLSTVELVLGADPLDPLAMLVDKSLLQADGTSYRVLDAIRAFAARRLRDAGEESDARDRHVGWCTLAVRRAYFEPGGRPLTLSLFSFEPLADELRAALHWTVTGGSVGAGLRLAGSLAPWWRERGRATEGRRWLSRLYERMAATAGSVPDADQADAYRLHAELAGADGEAAEELTYQQRAEQAAFRSGDPALLARTLAGRGAPLLRAGRLVEAAQVCRDTIDWAQREGAAGEVLAAVHTLAEVHWRQGALDAAAGLLAGARPLEAARPAERARRTVDMILGLVAMARGDVVAAHEHLVVALRARMAQGFFAGACDALAAMAARCHLGGDPFTAARLFGAVQAARARLRVVAGPHAGYWSDQQAAVRAALGDAGFDAAYAEGNGWTLDHAAAVALAVEHPDLAVDSHRFSAAQP